MANNATTGNVTSATPITNRAEYVQALGLQFAEQLPELWHLPKYVAMSDTDRWRAIGHDLAGIAANFCATNAQIFAQPAGRVTTPTAGTTPSAAPGSKST